MARLPFFSLATWKHQGQSELIAAEADSRATILKVPHHGSHTSSSPPFLAAVAPEVAVI
jgi:competence protein ComEC